MSRFGVRFRPDFSCNLCALSAHKPDRMLSIVAHLVHFSVKAVFFAGHFVIVAFVFMHIAGSIFIFNISKGQRPLRAVDSAQWLVVSRVPESGISVLRAARRILFTVYRLSSTVLRPLAGTGGSG